MCPDKREKAPHVRLLASLINSQVLFWQKKKKVAYSCGTRPCSANRYSIQQVYLKGGGGNTREG